jgi:hypothetical protein
MQLPVTRRLRPREATPFGPAALLGFGAGIAVGFFLSAAFGTGGKRRVIHLAERLGWPLRTSDDRVALSARVKAALTQDSMLAGESIEPLPAGPSGLALHGWVTSRAIRTRAWRLAQVTVHPEPVVNRLLVRGEDDLPPGPRHDDEPRSA